MESMQSPAKLTQVDLPRTNRTWFPLGMVITVPEDMPEEFENELGTGLRAWARLLFFGGFLIGGLASLSVALLVR